MARTAGTQFVCPKCGAQYQLVTVPAGASAAAETVACLACREPFPATKDGHIVKYFLLQHPRRGTSAPRNS
jgi:hypothetical protein